MILLHFLVLLAAVFVGARYGGIAIGFAGGAGVLVMGLLGATPGDLPLDVISFIIVVIMAVAAMQVAGGMDYLVSLADKVLRRNPRMLAIVAPIVTYTLTFMASTGQASFATMPVIVEVAKENNIRPMRSLAVGVVGSLLAITASPISAAVIFLSVMLEEAGTGWDFLSVIAVTIPSTAIAVLATSLIFLAWDKARGQTHLDDLPEYQRRLASGEVRPPRGAAAAEHRPGARLSVLLFLLGLVSVLVYAIVTSDKVGLIADPPMSAGHARIATMLATAFAIVVFCKIDALKIPNASTFKVGMTACVCILGVAWMGSTFMSNHEEWIRQVAGDFLMAFPWVLAIVLVLASALLYSQAATTKALMPTALAIGLSPVAIVASFPATSGMFILANYPTLLAAAELDDTGSTQVGKNLFRHPFLMPGLVATAISVAVGFGIATLIG